MNETAINYLNKLRLSKAKELMQKNSNYSLYDIARLSGYKTQSNFTESFKRIVGMSPFEYKKKYRE